MTRRKLFTHSCLVDFFKLNVKVVVHLIKTFFVFSGKQGLGRLEIQVSHLLRTAEHASSTLFSKTLVEVALLRHCIECEGLHVVGRPFVREQHLNFLDNFNLCVPKYQKSQPNAIYFTYIELLDLLIFLPFVKGFDILTLLSRNLLHCVVSPIVLIDKLCAHGFGHYDTFAGASTFSHSLAHTGACLSLSMK